jgi:nucleoside-diphosphate-sugar epimerase
LTDSRSEIQYIPYEQAWPKGAYEDLVYRAPDLEKIRACVNYDPKVDLEEALVRIIQYYER